MRIRLKFGGFSLQTAPLTHRSDDVPYWGRDGGNGYAPYRGGMADPMELQEAFDRLERTLKRIEEVITESRRDPFEEVEDFFDVREDRA